MSSFFWWIEDPAGLGDGVGPTAAYFVAI